MGNFCAGIVLYNPNLERLVLNINSILPQVERLYLVDNNSSNINSVIDRFNDNEKICFINNHKNLGIAKALNQLCSNALSDGFEWMLTLDQDTVSPSNIIQIMTPYTNNCEIGIICPAVHYEGINNKNDLTESNRYVSACMTSASLTRLSAWQQVGGFRDEYFIDFVDNEYCMRLGLSGYKILKVNSCIISHQLGESKTIKIFGRFSIKRSIHSPFRYYYMIRNNRAFIIEYKNNLNTPKEFVKLWYIIINALLFSNNKKASLHYILRGYSDAKRKKFGEYSN